MLQKPESASLPIPQAEGQRDGDGRGGEPQISSAPREDAPSPVVPESPRENPGAGREQRAAELALARSNARAVAAKARAEARLHRVNRLLDRMVTALVQYVLLKGRKQKPIPRADLKQFVRGDFQILFDEILAKASMKLKDVFGYELRMRDIKHHTYVLVYKPREADDEEDLDVGEDGPKLGLLMVILGLIYMKGNSVREAEIWDLLGRLGVWPTKYSHHFGYPKTLITEDFVQQQFLDYRQVPDTSPPEYEFSWGLRSNLEISKMKLLSFVANLQKKEPHHWPLQYQEALADEANRERARARQEALARVIARYRENN